MNEELTSEMVVRDHAKRIVEALLFASNTPLSIHRIRDILLSFHDFKIKDVIEIIHEYGEELALDGRPLKLEEIGDGFILRTSEPFSEFVAELYRDRKQERLSQAGREVLSIIAFKQPATKQQIEAIRGVDSAGTVQMLLEKELVEPCGQLEAPGRPTLFRVSEKFLQHFGLKNIEEIQPKRPQDPSLN